MNRNCNFKGINGSGECHKSWLTRHTAVENVCDLEEELQQTLLWWAGIGEDIANKQELLICAHHKEVFHSAFEKKFPKCCNIYGKHRKRRKAVKGGHIITLNLAKKLRLEGHKVCPGWQLCRNCLKIAKAAQHSEEGQMMEKEFDDSVDFGDEIARDSAKEVINSSFEELSISPIKLHAMPTQSKVSHIKTKLDRAKSTVEETALKAANVEKDIFKRKDPQSFCILEIKAKAADFDNLLSCMKEKIKDADYKRKIQILTLTPDSWSREAAAEFFNVSEYAIRTARHLRRERGILAIPYARKGRTIADDTKAAILNFYQDDEYSRVMPGKKDSISIGQKVHRQKRLILCNLHELYAEFKKVNPGLKVGFSKFCSLRPKWCVTVSSSGAHSICVCKSHQNTQLLVHAANINKSYKELIEMMVCSTENKMCMIHRCPNCPGTAAVKEYLQGAIESDLGEDIMFQQWQGTDRAMLVSQAATVEEFIEITLEALNKLTGHSFIAKSQAKYLKEKKMNLDSTR